MRSFIERHGETRFTNRLDPSPHGTRDRAGYVEVNSKTGERAFLFLSSGLREAINGHDLKRGIAALSAAGWLRREDARQAASVRKIEGTSHRVYIVELPDEEPALRSVA